MKTGNKILLVYLSIIALGLLLFMLDIRFFHHQKIRDKALMFNTKKININDFSFVKASNVYSLQFEHSDTSKIEIIYLKESPGIPELYFKNSGDTIILDSIKYAEIVKIYCKKPVKGLWAFNTNVESLDLFSDNLKVELNNSRLNDFYSDSVNISKILALHVKAINNSDVNLNDTEIDVLYLQMDSSNLNINSKVNVIKGELKVESYLNGRGFEGEISVKKDKSSQINLYD